MSGLIYIDNGGMKVFFLSGRYVAAWFGSWIEGHFDNVNDALDNGYRHLAERHPN